ncbi:MAG: CpaD family pilus assembly lipoprotein [Pseudomonadota bacterium]
MTALKHMALLTVAASALAACSQSPATIALGNNANREIAVREISQSMSVAAPEPGGHVSPIDRERVKGFAFAYQEEGAGQISVASPDMGDTTAAAAQVRALLLSAGVAPADIVEQTYAAPTGAPLRLEYAAYEVYAPDCPTYSEIQLSSTGTNTPLAPFGCSVTTGIAAMIADPSDLVGVQAMTPADAGRRAIVLQKYRNGESTASERTAAESGAVSNAVE